MEPSTSSPLWLVEYNESNSAFSRLLQIVEHDASRSERIPRIKIFSVLQNDMDVSELVLGYLKRAERSNITKSLKKLRLLDKFSDISILLFPNRARGLTNASKIFSASKLYIFDKTTLFGSDPAIKYVITGHPSNCELVVYSKKNMEITHHIMPNIPLPNSNSNQNGPSYQNSQTNHNSQNDQRSQSSQDSQIGQNKELHTQNNHGYDHIRLTAAANGERKLESLIQQTVDNLNDVLNERRLNVMNDECFSLLESLFMSFSELKKERVERNVNEEEENENGQRGDKKKEKEERAKKGKRVMEEKGEEEDEFEIRNMDEENEDTNGNDEEVVIVNEQMHTNIAKNNDEREERETNGEREKKDINLPYYALESMQSNHHKFRKKFDGASSNLEMIRSINLMTMAVESTILAAEEAYKSEERMKANVKEMEAEMKKIRKKMKKNMEKCEREKMRDKYFLQCFRCPITLEIMEDPVVASDGHTYERTAITTWLEDHMTSPSTNLPMPDPQLRENFILKALIKKWNDSEVIFNST